jgi:hypothetical protein
MNAGITPRTDRPDRAFGYGGELTAERKTAMTRIARLTRSTLIPVLACLFVSTGAGGEQAANEPAAAPAQPQEAFSSPEEAVKALQQATAAHDKAALRKIFGPALKDLISNDEVQNANDFTAFAKSLAEMTRLNREGDSKATLALGRDSWPYPIPIVKKDGKWFFDTAAGREEILNRRIGENELNAIGVCRAYVLAQREYASVDRNNDDILQYAQHFKSSPGTRDGLYWHAADDEEPSPFGPLMAQARSEGYGRKDKPKVEKRSPYHGYYFKILTKQGDKAPGGKYDYIINGHMVAGFALVAWPADYGSGGIMTFIVNQRGKVYQKDLGPKTPELGEEITEYNPDETWTLVSD